jgi:hypothetical protein
MDVLDDIVITGSSDGTARVWDLGQGTQQQLLRMPGKQSVTAVALPSVSLAVTASAKGGAVLWRAGATIRRFEPLPVSGGVLSLFTVHMGWVYNLLPTAEHTHPEQQQKQKQWQQTLQKQQAACSNPVTSYPSLAVGWCDHGLAGKKCLGWLLRTLLLLHLLLLLLLLLLMLLYISFTGWQCHLSVTH